MGQALPFEASRQKGLSALRALKATAISSRDNLEKAIAAGEAALTISGRVEPDG
jgi:hypothetical protein